MPHPVRPIPKLWLQGALIHVNARDLVTPVCQYRTSGAGYSTCNAGIVNNEMCIGYAQSISFLKPARIGMETFCLKSVKLFLLIFSWCSSHFYISASGHLRTLLNREVLETPPRGGYSCGFTQSRRPKASGHLRTLLNREVLETPPRGGYSCGFTQSRRPNLTQIWASILRTYFCASP